MDTLQILNRSFKEFLDRGDPRVKDWPLMATPFPTIAMCTAYIYFVKVAGPQFMRYRKPFELRPLMIVYNILLVFVNLYLFAGLFWYSYLQGYSLTCQPVDYSNNYNAVQLAKVGYLFYFVKFIEFIDTIIFVLRKKDNQISALHVIHHSLVPFSLWFGIKFAPGGYNTFFPLLNSFVHVIMYTYYALAAMGDRFKKYLGWKKYMTFLQIFQFVAVIVNTCLLVVYKCETSNAFIFANFSHALLFFVLFMNFFVKNYLKKPSRKQVLNTSCVDERNSQTKEHSGKEENGTASRIRCKKE